VVHFREVIFYASRDPLVIEFGLVQEAWALAEKRIVFVMMRRPWVRIFLMMALLLLDY